MIEIIVTSAFSKNEAGGNKAGIVFDHEELTEKQKKQISAYLGYSETAFVTKSEVADYKLEYFTPVEEVPLCGHATIATFSTLYHLKQLKKKEVTIETKAGILIVTVDEEGLVMMQQNAPAYYEILDASDFDFLGDVKIVGPAQIISTGLKDIILPVDDVDKINVDFEKMSQYSQQKGVVGVHAFCIKEDIIARNFAPLYGINEESATGTANCALAGYLFKYGEKKERYHFIQGLSMGLPSEIWVECHYHQDTIDSIFVGGKGYIVEKKRLD